MIKNIVFDLGNVILKDNPSIVLDEFNLDIYLYNDIKKNFFSDWMNLDLGLISLEDYFNQCNFNLEIPQNIKNKLLRYYEYRPMNNDILELIHSLKINNYNIYLLSNNNKETANYLRKLPFYQDISGDVFSCDYNTIKPNQDIYNILLNKYDFIPEECLFIDDNQNNINTAIELGFNVIKVEPDNYNNLINELSKYVEKI
jgi:putative hydrolase of the HAD superfamily